MLKPCSYMVPSAYLSVGRYSLDIFSRTYSTQTVPPDNFPPNLGHLPPQLKQKFEKMALTRTPDPNQSTSISFVYVNSRSLYIVDRLVIVAEGRNVLHHVKKGGELSRGNCSAEYVRGNMSRGEMFGSRYLTLTRVHV